MNFPFLPNAKRPHDRKIDFLSCGLEKQRMERLFTPPDFSLVSSFQRGSTASFSLSYPCSSVSCPRFLNGSCVKDTLIESQNSIESAFPHYIMDSIFEKSPFPHFSSCSEIKDVSLYSCSTAPQNISCCSAVVIHHPVQSPCSKKGDVK